MDAIKSFFKKYNAVPAGKSGEPEWASATTDALIGWAEKDCKAFDLLYAEEEYYIRIRMIAIGNELYQRCTEVGTVEMRSAVDAIFARVGWENHK